VFEVGFWEMVVCAVIALVVLGPEKLPGLARTLGRWTGQARVYMRNLNAELDRELHARELREQMTRAKSALQEQTAAAQEAVNKTLAPPPPPAP
jgi:sec-independent protein translocase protein TatB